MNSRVISFALAFVVMCLMSILGHEFFGKEYTSAELIVLMSLSSAWMVDKKESH